MKIKINNNGKNKWHLSNGMLQWASINNKSDTYSLLITLNDGGGGARK